MSAVGTEIERPATLGRNALSVLAAAMEASAIIGASCLAGTVYHLLAYGAVGPLLHFLGGGALAAWVFTVAGFLRDDYSIQSILGGSRGPARIFLLWNTTALTLALIGYLTGTTELFSRGWIGSFYTLALAGLLLSNDLVHRVLLHLIASGRLQRRKLMVVSVGQDVRRAARRLTAKGSGAEVAAVVKLERRFGETGRSDFQAADLANAVSWARSLSIDDVVVLIDWMNPADIGEVVNALSVLPVGIHLDAGGVLQEFSRAKVSQLGDTPVLSLRAQPLSPGQAAIKRGFDIVAASLGLIVLSPLFAVVALAIRCESKGPALFLQRRRGYNLRVFQIWKFRTMTVMDDGEHVVQATRNDVRVTRIGRFLRRYSIDELPQLINVLKGEMSLVGPRPHAVAHDRQYERTLLLYPRRLNMRPGITGWAQVNGLRGKTDTNHDMAKRLEYDLHYIDNWSLGLDIYIIVLTVLSPRTYRNAH